MTRSLSLLVNKRNLNNFNPDIFFQTPINNIKSIVEKSSVNSLYNDFGYIDDIFALKKVVEDTFNISLDEISNFSKGLSLVYKIIIKGESYILKLPNKKKVIRHWSSKEAMEEFFNKKLPFYYRERLNGTPEKRICQEIKVLKNWKSNGIDTTEIFKTNEENIIILKYIKGENYKDLVDKRIFNKEHLDSFLKTTKQIREISYEKKDKNYLHSDPYLQNFMFDEDNKVCKVIDPGRLIKSELTFEETDTYINLFFCYNLLNKVLYEVETLNIRKNLLESFLGVIDKPSLERMANLNKPIPSFYLAYQENIAKEKSDKDHFEWYNSFGKNNFEYIQKIINEKLKN